MLGSKELILKRHNIGLNCRLYWPVTVTYRNCEHIYVFQRDLSVSVIPVASNSYKKNKVGTHISDWQTGLELWSNGTDPLGPCYCKSCANPSNQHGWVTRSANWPTTLPQCVLYVVLLSCCSLLLNPACVYVGTMHNRNYYRTHSGWIWDQLFHLTDFGDRLKILHQIFFFFHHVAAFKFCVRVVF